MKFFSFKTLRGSNEQLGDEKRCGQCRYLSNNISREENDYIAYGCIREQSFFYCEKQNRYQSARDLACNEYVRK